jgi:hypothetical protein
MRIPAGWLAGTPRLAADCAWRGCGRPAGVDVLVSSPGEPSLLAVLIGGYCLGHAVITGIEEAQARAGGHLWYVACCGGEPLTILN